MRGTGSDTPWHRRIHSDTSEQGHYQKGLIPNKGGCSRWNRGNNTNRRTASWERRNCKAQRERERARVCFNCQVEPSYSIFQSWSWRESFNNQVLYSFMSSQCWRNTEYFYFQVLPSDPSSDTSSSEKTKVRHRVRQAVLYLEERKSCNLSLRDRNRNTNRKNSRTCIYTFPTCNRHLKS